MLIGDNYKVESDSLNYILCKKHTACTGKVTWREIGYYGNLANALKALVEREVKGTGLKDLETVVTKIAGVKACIQETLEHASG